MNLRQFATTASQRIRLQSLQEMKPAPASARDIILQPLKPLVAALLLLLASATGASAATIGVDGIRCTLAEAITAANTNAPAGGCTAGNDRNAGGDIIQLAADVLLTFADNVDASGCATGLPVISSKIRITGGRHVIARVDGAPVFRVLDSRPGILTLEDVTVSNGSSEAGCSGAGINGSTVTLIRSTVSNNHGGGYGSVDKVEGAGIAATSLTLIRSIVSDNEGQGIGVVGSMLLSHSTVTRNKWRFFTFTAGGGLTVLGTAVIADSTISDNHALAEAGVGGGLYIDGNATVTNSTVSGNHAEGVYGLGGGVFLFRGTATFINSTISGNLAEGCLGCWAEGGSGGGIFSAGADLNRGPDAGVTLIHTTVTRNVAAGPYTPMNPDGGFGGGVASYALTLTNSIIAKNLAANPALGDCSAIDVHYTGMNLIGDGSCGAASSGQLTGDPLIGPLGDYGGSAPIHPLLPGSPAIDQIAFNHGAGCDGTSVTADQRGVPRLQSSGHGNCDIGAIEYTGFPANPVLDNFNRADGKIGPNWSGDDNRASYRIVDGQVRVRDGGPMYWSPAVFGADQEAYVTLTKIDPNGSEHDLLLKVQGDPARYTLGEIEVLYDVRAHAVRIETLLPGNSTWTKYQDIPVTFEDGDQLGGRALATGDVQIYRNNVLLATITLNSTDQQFFNHRGGKIGLWFDAAPKATVDSFGGGTVAR